MRSNQIIVFRIGNEEYAIPTERVREIMNYVPVTKLPQTADYFEGIINVRGKVIPVVDFAAKLGLSTEPVARQIVIVEAHNKEIGLIVDVVTEVIQTVAVNYVSVQSLTESGQNTALVYKQADRIIILPDLDEVLPEMTAA